MKIKLKKLHPEARIPTRGSLGAAGYDFYALSYECDGPLVKYKTGIAIEIPEGYVGLIFPRSSIYKKDLTLSNCVGVIDEDYRGEISFVFRMLFDENTREAECYDSGDRIGQLVLIKYDALEFEEVSELSHTSRGQNGFGSTGK